MLRLSHAYPSAWLSRWPGRPHRASRSLKQNNTLGIMIVLVTNTKMLAIGYTVYHKPVALLLLIHPSDPVHQEDPKNKNIFQIYLMLNSDETDVFTLLW